MERMHGPLELHICFMALVIGDSQVLDGFFIVVETFSEVLGGADMAAQNCNVGCGQNKDPSSRHQKFPGNWTIDGLM